MKSSWLAKPAFSGLFFACPFDGRWQVSGGKIDRKTSLPTQLLLYMSGDCYDKPIDHRQCLGSSRDVAELGAEGADPIQVISGRTKEK
jgi:hypothetical protein